MRAGAGATYALFFATPGTTRTEVIAGFDASQDAIGLFGYGSMADASALLSANTSGGATTLSLSDGTHVVLLGAPSLQATNFF
jgi:hypothetical protein